MTQAIPHPLQDSMKRLNINRIAVVDDAFDPVALSSFQEGEAKEFIDRVNDDDELLKEFHKFATGADDNRFIDAADLTDAVAGRLWEKRETLAGLKEIVGATLFRVHANKVAQVQALYQFLTDVLGIPSESLKTFGTGSSMPDEEFDLAFVDYRFGPSRDDQSVDRAVRWATHLYKSGRSFIILMSAEPEGKSRQDVFRAKSKLTRGLFEFVSKDEIEDSGKFGNRLKSFCAGLSTRHAIHSFAAAAEAAADVSLNALKESIHSLGIEDYAYLEQISLRQDGHPLGDYMLWLFGEYFAHQLAINQSLQNARSSVNGLKYENFLPLQRPPSVTLAAMYSAAITEPVFEGWGAHPRDLQAEATAATVDRSDAQCPEEATGNSVAEPQQEPQPFGETVSTANAAESAGIAEVAPINASAQDILPLFQLGDLLVASKDKPAYLVINAGCDLQFSPGTKRSCDIDQSILLIPGRFESLHERGEERNAKRTELYELDGERFRVIWQHTRARALAHKLVRQEFKNDGYHRKSRLKLPYALEVQQHFASQLTRVGVPTPTPFFREYAVEVYVRDADNSFLRIDSVANGLVVFHHRDSDQFILTVDCINEVLQIMDQYAAQVEGEICRDSTISKGNANADTQQATTDSAIYANESTETAGRAGANNGKKGAEGDRTRKRRKYVEDLREARQALALGCLFQDSLSAVPAEGKSKQHFDEISLTDKRCRLEIRHAPTLAGEFNARAPLVLAFAMASTVGPQEPRLDEAALGESMRRTENPAEGVGTAQ